MTDVEIIKVELECVQSDCHNKDNRVCDNCRLALPSADIIRAYNSAIKALEENAELKNDMATAIPLLEKVECTSCIYTDSPCVRGDYPMKDGRCTHHKHFGDEIAALKAQIEKMKNWCNCKNYQQCLIELAEQGKGMKPSECCVNCKKWEIKEND